MKWKEQTRQVMQGETVNEKTVFSDLGSGFDIE